MPAGWNSAGRSRPARPGRPQAADRPDRGDQIVAFDADPALIGQILDVKITAARQMTLFGELA